jgi:hypothetical protein
MNFIAKRFKEIIILFTSSDWQETRGSYVGPSIGAS